MKFALTSYPRIHGVSLTKPEMNLLVKLGTKYGVEVDDQVNFATNGVNGIKAHVECVVASLIGFIQEVAYNGSFTFNGKKVNVNDFDRVRYLVMKLDRSAYYKILD